MLLSAPAIGARWRAPAARRLYPGTVCSIGRRGWVHFVGIGGTGLSALALLALKQGWKVSGSDASLSNRLQYLKNEGAVVFSGHDMGQVIDSQGRLPDVVVASSAIPAENVEIAAARELGIPVMKRAAWLGKITKDYELIAVAGTHGKSTTTAMLAVALRSLGEDATAIVGADVPQFGNGTNAVAGSGRLFVLEADEYDGCFLGVSPSVAVITSIEWEHVDMFPDEASVRLIFEKFVQQLKPDGFLVVYGDSAGTQSLIGALEQHHQNQSLERASWLDMKQVQAVTYGLDKGNDWRAIMLTPNVQGGTDYVAVHKNRPMARVSLKVPGTHNVLNSLAAVVSIALLASRGKGAGDGSAQLKAQAEGAGAAGRALSNFVGLRRRFEFVGTVFQCEIYDDYAHHPTEIRAVLQAARQRFERNHQIWVVFQPHTYSRLAKMLQKFASAFGDADRVIVTEVYAAREEENTWNIGGSHLAAAITGPPAMYIPTLDEVVERLLWELTTLDRNNYTSNPIILLTLGAGDVNMVGPRLMDTPKSTSPRA